ncbi:sigma factor [Micromonospora sp. NPDC005197]|uniref:sigma factor n=1 Tax=Micromonospora sp. NPDC005197 TaxID=3157020 RepID=UPI0033BDF1DE
MTTGDRARDGFADFVRAETAGLTRFAYLLTGDRHHAEDLVQVALARAAVRWERIEDPPAYLRRVLCTQARQLVALAAGPSGGAAGRGATPTTTTNTPPTTSPPRMSGPPDEWKRDTWRVRRPEGRTRHRTPPARANSPPGGAVAHREGMHRGDRSGLRARRTGAVRVCLPRRAAQRSRSHSHQRPAAMSRGEWRTSSLPWPPEVPSAALHTRRSRRRLRPTESRDRFPASPTAKTKEMPMAPHVDLTPRAVLGGTYGHTP